MPNDTPMVSETEAVKRERAAFVRGVRTAWFATPERMAGEVEGMRAEPDEAAVHGAAAAILYPLPKVRRPRELVIPPSPAGINYETRYRVIGGELEQMVVGLAAYRRVSQVFASHVCAVAALLADPAEEVDADAA